jgi:prepilin-type N-terminal cleavage/methylation domain-containing protein
MDAGRQRHGAQGYTLIELMLVLAVVAVCIALLASSAVNGLSQVEARGSAQTWQGAAAWSQVGVLWHGGSSSLLFGPEKGSIENEPAGVGGPVDPCVGGVSVATNYSRWRNGSDVKVTFGGAMASPDGGGSLYFRRGSAMYRVVVRPESGFSVRNVEDHTGP